MKTLYQFADELGLELLKSIFGYPKDRIGYFVYLPRTRIAYHDDVSRFIAALKFLTELTTEYSYVETRFSNGGLNGGEIFHFTDPTVAVHFKLRFG